MEEDKLVNLILEMIEEECGCGGASRDVFVGEPAMTATLTTVSPQRPSDGGGSFFEEEPNEGYMVMQNLHKIHEYSGKLMSLLDESMDMPEWVEDKLATCSDRISSVFHYLEYKMTKE